MPRSEGAEGSGGVLTLMAIAWTKSDTRCDPAYIRILGRWGRDSLGCTIYPPEQTAPKGSEGLWLSVIEG